MELTQENERCSFKVCQCCELAMLVYMLLQAGHDIGQFGLAGFAARGDIFAALPLQVGSVVAHGWLSLLSISTRVAMQREDGTYGGLASVMALESQQRSVSVKDRPSEQKV
ncbi:hypothetical protein BU25DRAFT_222123 [Macroventuria anomochaeta]|uniref:Uncharacterized protein n=1 Tax=Macroventuria anomochaeta TaxID=301207 RepID=A0ACB6SD20_9PLEO|nr:uncharacterized protein BU25DRAFT_222123 [Macroventuria anomochaeta]KAF2630997.1 hypothetical protein BU25DRAFT_222123 [Macroventuria anomochaeta]